MRVAAMACSGRTALGQARTELGSDIRIAPHRGYVIFLRYRDATVEIINVLSARREIEALYNRETSH
jgi:toxin ParE1/3/4